MRVERLEIENWLSYPRRWVLAGDGPDGRPPTIDFSSSPLLLIDGDNGSGKSALLDAIIYALFGRYTRGAELADAIRSGEDAAHIRLTFAIPSGTVWTRYRVERILYRKSGKNNGMLKRLAGDKEEIIATGQLDINQEIERLLGIGYEAFTAVVFLRQNAAGTFMQEDGKQYDRLFDLCQLGVYDEIYKVANQRKKTADTRVKDLQRDFDDASAATDERLAEVEAAAEAQRVERDGCQASLAAAQSLQEKVRRAGRLSNQVGDLCVQLTTWQGLLDQAMTIRQAAAWIAVWQRVQNTLVSARATHKRLETVGPSIERQRVLVARLADECEQLRGKYQDLEADSVAKSAKQASYQSLLVTLTTDKANTDQELKDLRAARALDGEIDRLTRQLAAWHARLAVLPQAGAAKSEADLLRSGQQVLGSVATLQSAIGRDEARATRLQGQSSKALERVALLQPQISECRNVLAQLKAQAESSQRERNEAEGQRQAQERILKQRKSALQSGQCPTCGEPMQGAIGKRVQAEVSDIESLIGKLKARVTDIDQLLELGQKESVGWQQRLDGFNVEVQRLGAQARADSDQATQVEAHASQTRAEIGKAWRAYLGQWRAIACPAWLNALCDDTPNAIQHRLEELAELEGCFDELSDLQRDYTAQGKVLSDKQVSRPGILVASPISDEQIADAQGRFNTLQDRCTKGDELLRQLQPAVQEAQGKASAAKLEWDRRQAEHTEAARKLAGMESAYRADADHLAEANRYLQGEAVAVRQFEDLAELVPAAVRDDNACSRLVTSAEGHTSTAALLKDLQAAETNSGKTQGQIEVLQRELDDLRRDIGDVTEATVDGQVTKLQVRLGELGGKVTEADRLAATTRAQNAKRHNVEPKLIVAKNQLWAYKEIEKALGPGRTQSGPLRIEMMRELMDQIADGASTFLKSMHLPVRITAENSRFCLHDERHAGDSRLYTEFSGGEQFAIAVAVSLAVGQVTHDAGSVRCLFIDEGFGALDSRNRGSIITNAISQLIQSQVRDQVVVVTHLEDLKAFFPERISLARDGDRSVLAPPSEE
jgi:exonuclease SbcC